MSNDMGQKFRKTGDVNMMVPNTIIESKLLKTRYVTDSLNNA